MYDWLAFNWTEMYSDLFYYPFLRFLRGCCFIRVSKNKRSFFYMHLSRVLVILFSVRLDQRKSISFRFFSKDICLRSSASICFLNMVRVTVSGDWCSSAKSWPLYHIHEYSSIFVNPFDLFPWNAYFYFLLFLLISLKSARLFASKL